MEFYQNRIIWLFLSVIDTRTRSDLSL